jgi:hypothetical protein
MKLTTFHRIPRHQRFHGAARGYWVSSEPLIAVEVDEVPVMPRRVVDRFGVMGFVEVDRDSGGFGDRSVVVEGKRSPRL